MHVFAAPTLKTATVHDLRRRYTFALTAIAALTLLTQLVLQGVILGSQDDARVVNIAGRQRMLSQSISKDILALEDLPEDERSPYLAELSASLNLWQDSDNALQFGNSEVGTPGNNSSIITDLYAQADIPLYAMLAAGRCVVAQYQGIAEGECATQTDESLRTVILTNEPLFLNLMNRIVFQYDAEAGQAIQAVRLISGLLMIVTLLVVGAEGLLIFRPIAIRLQVTLDALNTAQRELTDANTSLEQRVQERTIALQQANTELATANEEIRDYTSFVTHDLRSPIASMRGFLQELNLDLTDLRGMINGSNPSAAALLEDSIPEAVTALEGSNNQLDRLTRQLLNLARQGRRELDRVPVDVSALVKQTLQSYVPQITTNDVQIDIPAQFPVVESDPVLVEQVFANLISNALKYLDPARRGRIVVEAMDENERVVFSVRDNGRGIAPDDHDKVFKLFRRAGSQDTEGEGIGLYHVRNLLRRLGGSIWFESQVGSGTTFYFSIPKTMQTT